MSDFSATIKAILDTSGIEKQLRDIEKQYKIQFKFEPLDTSKLANQMNAAGASIGDRFASSFGKSAAPLIRTSLSEAIANMQNILKSANFDEGSISTIIKNLNEMNIEVGNLHTTVNNGDVKLSIRGIDELGRSVTIIKEFCAETSQISTVAMHIDQDFKTSADEAKAFQKEVSSAFSILKSKTKEMNSLELKLKGLDPSENSSEINAIQSRIKELKGECLGLIAIFKEDFSTKQLIELANISKQANGEVEILNGRMADSVAAAAQKQINEITFKIDNGSLAADFKSVEIMVEKAKSLGATLSGDAGKNYAELKLALSTMGKTDGSVSIEQKIDAYKRFNELLPIVRQQVSNLTKEEQAAAKTAKTLTNSNKLSYDITDWMNKNAKAAEVFGDRLKDLKDRLAGNKDPEELRKITTEFAAIKSEAKASGLVTNSFSKSLKDTTKQVLGLTSTAAVIQKLIRVVKNMYQCVYDIDTAMTNLKKVTDETDKTYSAFLSRAAESAKSLGRTVSEMVTQVAEWSKLGYSLNEAEVLSKWSSIYANVGEVDEKTAVSDMVTAMKAFNIEASNAQTIIDSLNELGNKFAVSSADLGAGLSNSASAMNAAGTDMNKTLAMLTGGAEITQNAGEFGNFLKTASMRIRGMKSELEELGEEVGDNVDLISKVQTQILNLTHGKVNIFNDKGEFRDYYDIMKDIAGVVDSLTSTERASLYEILFGKVRSNQGSALIQAFQSGQIENAYNAALGSTGSAMEEQTKWIESLEGKTEQLKAAWQELSITVMNSDFLKVLVDSGKVILTVLNNIIENIGVLNTLLISLAAYKGIKSIS